MFQHKIQIPLCNSSSSSLPFTNCFHTSSKASQNE